MRKTMFGRGLALLCAFVVLVASVVSVDAVTKKTYSFSVSPSERGEYNIVLSGGNMTSTPKLYYKNILGKEVAVKGIAVTGNKSKYTIKAGLDKQKYYVKVEGYAKPKCTFSKNRDRYSTSSTKLLRGVSWEPNSKSKQPFTLAGLTIVQVAYLTKEEALAYAMNINNSVYLKIVDTNSTIAGILVAAGISSTSVIGKAIARVGKSTLAKTAKAIVTGVGGVSLMPKLKKTVVNDVRRATNDFTTGLKIIVYCHNSMGNINAYSGLSNAYSSWNQRANSVYGELGYRGKFSTFKKLYGWY